MIRKDEKTLKYDCKIEMNVKRKVAMEDRLLAGRKQDRFAEEQKI